MVLGHVRVKSTYVIATNRSTGMPDKQETVIQTPVKTNGISSDNVHGGGDVDEEEHVEEERGKSRLITVPFTV